MRSDQLLILPLLCIKRLGRVRAQGALDTSQRLEPTECDRNEDEKNDQQCGDDVLVENLVAL